MKGKKSPGQIIPIIVILSLLAGCSQLTMGTTEIPGPVPGIDEPIVIRDVEVLVHEARVRDNFQTHYIMTHATPPYTFYEVVVSIEGAEDPLTWGEENLKLLYQGQENEMIMARWIVVGDNIQYKADEDFTYRYVYIYNVAEKSEFSEYRLGLPEGTSIDVSSIVTISGFEKSKAPKREAGEFSAVGGGLENQASGPYSTVSGGSVNAASAYHTAVGGGNLNIANASHATVGGGRENSATYFYATVGGGYANSASGRDATIGGGSRNTASSHHATVSGGIRNNASSSDATIAGGAYNAASDVYAAVGGGTRNAASGYAAVISGGAGNTASGNQAAIAGGLGNRGEGDYTTVSGGHGNSADGSYATIPGGSLNQAGGDYSLAAGQRAIVAPDHPGVFLFADASDFDFKSLAANEFGARATGGVRFVTALDESGETLSGVDLAPGSGSWSSLSDRAAKANFAPVDEVEILETLAALHISSWNYRGQDPTIRHIGPTAQDFRAAFGLGEDDKHISGVDADGVALAAIQELYQQFQEQENQVAAQHEQIEALQARLETLEKDPHGSPDPAMLLVMGFVGGLLAYRFGLKAAIAPVRFGVPRSNHNKSV